VKVLVIVNASPWGSSLGVTAWRLVRAMLDGGLEVAAVFFREEGVYQAVRGRADDAGTPNLYESWLELQRDRDTPLLLCSSAAQRRLAGQPAEGFRETGLAEVLELALSCDRVVTF
jgi:tRNA 2-thiouridine synthesizing protein D